MKTYRRFERLGGNRPGRNVCVSSRITDSEDDKLDILAEKGQTTRSKILSDALTRYFETIKNTDTTVIGINDTTNAIHSNTNKGNWDSTLVTVTIKKDEDGLYIGDIPLLRGCYCYGETLDELFRELKKAIKADIKFL